MSLYDIQQFASSIAAFIMPVAGAVYTWFATRQANARKEIDTILKRVEKAELQLVAAGHTANALEGIATRFEDQERRLLNIEIEFKHLPRSQDVSDLKDTISDLKGTVKAMEAQLTAFGRTVQNIDTYLRKGDPK